MTRRGGPPRRKGPSNTQLMVLAYMRKFFEEQDQLPPVAWVAQHFGWASANGAQFHIDVLVEYRLLELNACGRYRFARPAQAQQEPAAAAEQG